MLVDTTGTNDGAPRYQNNDEERVPAANYGPSNRAITLGVGGILLAILLTVGLLGAAGVFGPQQEVTPQPQRPNVPEGPARDLP